MYMCGDRTDGTWSVDIKRGGLSSTDINTRHGCNIRLLFFFLGKQYKTLMQYNKIMIWQYYINFYIYWEYKHELKFIKAFLKLILFNYYLNIKNISLKVFV